jgi:hypothetical protein
VDIDQIGISRRYRRLARQKTPAWLRPPLTAPGSWWATTNGWKAADFRFLIRVLCTARYPEPEDIKIAGKDSGKTDANVFQNESEGSPTRGTARSKQAKHLSMTQASAPTAVESGSDCLCRRAGASAL